MVYGGFSSLCYLEQRSVKEERQKLKQIITDVVVGFLQSQDTRREEGLVFI